MIVKQSTSTGLPCVLIDSTDFKTLETGVVAGSVTCQYAKEGDVSLTAKAMGIGTWDELGDGVYIIRFSDTELDTVGKFIYTIKVANILTYHGMVEIREWTNDDIKDAIEEIPSLTNSKTFNNTALASIQSEATDALNAYDPPTRTEATSDKNEILADTSAIITSTGLMGWYLSVIDGKVDVIDSNIDAILIDTAEIGIAGIGLTNLGGMSIGMKAEVESEVNDALVTYDPPTRIEATSDKNEILADTSAIITSTGLIGWYLNVIDGEIDIIDANVDSIKLKTDNLPADPTSETNATANKDAVILEVNNNETKIDTAITDIGIVDGKVDIIDTNVDSILTSVGIVDGKVDIIDSNVDAILIDTSEIGVAGAGLTNLGGMSIGMKAEVESEANDALVAYDPPTRIEATSDKNEIIAEIDATQTSTGIIGANIIAIKAKTDNLPTDPTSEVNAAINRNTIVVEVNATETKVDTAITDIGTVDGKVDTAIADIGTVDGKVDTAITDIGTVDGKVDTAITDIGTVDGKVDSVQIDTTAIKGKTDLIPADPAETSDITTAHSTTNTLISALPTAVSIDTRLSSTHGAGQWDATASGPGGTECTYTVEIDGAPAQGVAVWVSTDEAGLVVIAGARITNSSGGVTFMLDLDILYYIWCRKDGTNFSNPYTKIWT